MRQEEKGRDRGKEGGDDRGRTKDERDGGRSIGAMKGEKGEEADG